MPLIFGKNNENKNKKKLFRFLFVFVSLVVAIFLSHTSTAYASDRYWIGGTGNWSDTAHWSDSDGGGSGFSVPTSTDNVYFSAGSFSANGAIVTIDTTANTLSLDFSGLDQTMTLTNSANNLNVYGSLTLSMKLATNFTSTGYLYLKATTSVNITSNGNTSTWNRIYFDGIGGTWTNQDNWIYQTVTFLRNGTWNTNSKTISLGVFYTSESAAKTLTLGSSLFTTWMWGNTNPTNFTFNYDTSTVKTTGSDTLSGADTFYNLILQPLALNSSVKFVGNITVNNDLTIIGYNSTNRRILVASNIIGTQRTFTVGGTVTASNADFRDIRFANAIDLSGISGGSGDAGGNTGITFTTAQPQYFKHTSGAVNWSDSSKWFSDSSPRTTPGRVPLPQDDVTFDASSFTGASTLTVDVARIGKSLDMSTVNQSLTMTLVNDTESYGGYILGNNITQSGSYTTYLMGRSNFNLNTYNKTLYQVIVNAYNGTYTLQSNLITNYLWHYNGTFDANDFNLELKFYYHPSATGVLYMGNGLWTVSNTTNPGFSIGGPLTFYAEGSTLKFIAASSSNAVTFFTADGTYNKVWFSGTHTGNYEVRGGGSISELIIDPGRKVLFTAGKLTNIGKFTALGTSLNPITISSITGATHTLNYTGGSNVSADYLNLSYSIGTPSNKWYAGINSTNGGNNSGWIFASAPNAPTGLTPTSGNTQVSLSWTAGADNGSAITDYVIDYKLTSEPTVWTTFSDGISTLTTATVTGLTNRSSYDFRVSAANAVGQGTASSIVSSTPADPLDRYWIGGTGNWNDTAHWSNIDGGSGGQSVPTSVNDVYFSAGSFSVDGSTVTLDAVANTKSLDFSGLDQTMTLSSSVNSLNVYGNLTEHGTRITFSFTGTAYFYSKGSGTYITNGSIKNNWNKWYIDGAGITVINGDDLDIGYTHGNVVVYLVNGKWDTNGKTVKTWDFVVQTGTKELKLGSSNFYAYRIDIQAPSNFTFNYDTSTVFTQYNIIGALTFNNLTLQKISALDYVNFSADIIVLNNLVIAGVNSTTQRFLVYSNTVGTQRTITVDPAKVTASNVDFRDIRFANAIDLSGISGGSGDAGGNTGITFTTAQPQYFKHTSGAVNWSDSSKWFSDSSPRTTPGRVPLPQDDVTFDASSFTGTSTLTVNVPRIGKSLDMSAVNQSVTMALSNNVDTYGSFVLGNNITPSSTTAVRMYSRTNSIINTFEKKLGTIDFYCFGTTCTVMSNLITTYNIYVYYGAVDFNDFDITCQYASVQTNGTWIAGNGTINLNFTSAVIEIWVALGTFLAENSTIKFIPDSGSANLVFNGNNKIYNKVWFSGSHTGNFDIKGNNNISELIIDPGRKVRFTAGTTQQIGKLTAVGTVSNPITISSITNATHTLNYTGTGNAVADYLNLSYSTGTPSNKWYASHSTNGGNNSGWTFANQPDAPTAVGVTAGNAQASLTWSAPAYNGGTAITDYTIEYKLTSEPIIWSTFSDGISTNTTGIVTGLVNGSSYDFRIRAVNAIGQGSESTTVATTPITIPGAPLTVVATRGNTQASVAFLPPLSDGGSVITSYTVTSNPGSQIGTGSSSPIIVTGLTNGTPYTFTVTATNAAGTGPASSASSPVTPATIPDAPTTPVTVAVNAQVSISWTAPVWNGGSAVTDYAIEYKLSSEPIVWSLFADGISPNTTSIVNGLSNGLSYDFRIYSVNDVGQGSQSVETSAMPITVPDAPTAVSGIAGNAQAIISFTPPLFNGGSTINNYTVTSTPGNFTATGNASPITVTGLTNGTQYIFTVVATNSVGDSFPSAPSDSITPVTVPDAPTFVIATEGNKQASISFTAPLFDGGTPITSYTATSTPGNFTGSASSSPIIVTGLTNGTTYTFKVKATNSVGPGGESSSSNEVTLSTEPSQPLNLASTVLGSSIGLTWSAPSSNGGSAIIDYIIEYQLSTGGTWTVFAEGSNTNTTVTVIGLSNRVSYDFRVIAVNAIGQSSPSDITTATPGERAQVIIQNFSDVTVPNIETNIRITNEGTSDYEYQYTWCLTSSAENLCGGGDDLFSATAARLIEHTKNYDTSLTSTMLVPGDYYFHIKVFYGSESSRADQSFTAFATYPDTPTSPTATRGNALATVSFTPSSFDGGSPVTIYTVTSNPGGIIGTGTSSPMVVSGLTNGIEYNFNVTATNIIGTSPASLYSNSIIPATIPDAPTGVTAIAGNSQVILSWNAPTNFGGSPVTDYIIEYKLSTASTWSIFSDGISVSTTSTVTGLTNNSSYDFKISSVNAIGQSGVIGANAISPENTQNQQGSSGSSPQVTTQEPIIEQAQLEQPVNIPTSEIPTTKPTVPLKPIKTPTIIIDNEGNNVVVQSPNMKANEITVTPTEKSPIGNNNKTVNNILKIIGKVALIITGATVIGGGILLLVLRLLRNARLTSKIVKPELPPEIPTEPRRKI